MRPISPKLLICALPLAFAGCVEGELTYLLNPDGSGKVNIDVVMPATPTFIRSSPGGETLKTPTDHLAKIRKEFVQSILKSSRGVTAWEDVSVNFKPDGRIHFKGIAYFQDASRLKIQTIPAPVPLLRKSGGKLRLTFKKDGDDAGRKSPRTVAQSKLDPRKLSGKMLDQYVRLERVKYQQSKGLLLAFLTGLDLKSSFRVPGPVSSVQGFERPKADTVSLRLEGRQVIEEIDRIMSKSDRELGAYVKEHGAIVSSMNNGPPGQDLSPLFHKLSTAAAVVDKPKGPLFDFSAAVERARSKYPQLRKQLDVPDLKLPGNRSDDGN